MSWHAGTISSNCIVIRQSCRSRMMKRLVDLRVILRQYSSADGWPRSRLSLLSSRLMRSAFTIRSSFAVQCSYLYRCWNCHAPIKSCQSKLLEDWPSPVDLEGFITQASLAGVNGDHVLRMTGSHRVMVSGDGLIEPIAVATMPIMCFLVAYHLGPEWVILINYQTVQGLFCEVRKWRGRESERSSNERRPGWPDRKRLYDRVLEVFCKDWELPFRSNRRGPNPDKCPSLRCNLARATFAHRWRRTLTGQHVAHRQRGSRSRRSTYLSEFVWKGYRWHAHVGSVRALHLVIWQPLALVAWLWALRIARFWANGPWLDLAREGNPPSRHAQRQESSPLCFGINEVTDIKGLLTGV